MFQLETEPCVKRGCRWLQFNRGFALTERRYRRFAAAPFHRLLVSFAQTLKTARVFIRTVYFEQRCVLAFDAA
ncbi:hypothetical protein CNN82_15415 [Pseudomonas frederiksbergensis]|uniref:Uncharacterized protein n=1 Tax=Pseudomonas frederiksbergensis TaxID=104087 RepID=A0AB33EF64_9PSED|nr:hypothetical protein CNN82_15415 [Pseudomonas frederiksbergensis]